MSLSKKIIKLVEDEALSYYCDSWSVSYRTAIKKLLSDEDLDGKPDGTPALITVSDDYQCMNPKTLVRQIKRKKAYLLAGAITALVKETTKH